MDIKISGFFFKIGIGIIVELFALVPSLFIVQFFRRIRNRQQISPLQQALNKIKPSTDMFVFSREIIFII